MNSFLSQLIDRYRSSQFSKNILRSILLYSFNTLFIFLSYPIYIKYLGVETYAVWSLLSVIISFAELGNFGMGNALISFVALEKKDNNNVNIEKLLSNAAYIILIPLTIFFPILLFFNVEIISLLKIPIEYYEISKTLIPYIYIIIVLYLFNDNLKSVVVGIGRLDMSNLFFTLSNLIKLIIAVICFVFGCGLISMLISTILSNSILLIAYMILLNRNGIRIKPHRIDFIIQKKIFSFGIKMLGISIMNMLMMPISKIILADINLKAVAFFEIGSKIVYSVFGIIQKGIYAFLPQMSKYKHELKENVATIKKICSRTSKLSILLSILLFVFLDITAPYWMHIWLGANYDIEILKSFYIIQVGAFFAIFSLPYYYSLMGLGKENICLYESIIRCIANIILLVSLMNIKNLSILVYISFALATIVSNLYVLIKCKIFIKNSI